MLGLEEALGQGCLPRGREKRHPEKRCGRQTGDFQGLDHDRPRLTAVPHLRSCFRCLQNLQTLQSRRRAGFDNRTI